MDARRFAAGYRRDIPEYEWHPQVLRPALGRLWWFSHHFGQRLHDYLSGVPLDDDAEFEQTYIRWLLAKLDFVESRITLPEFPSELFSEAWMALNFHRINLSMCPMWTFLSAESWEQEDPALPRAIGVIQDLLAMLGSRYVVNREGMADDYGYFQLPNQLRGAYEGALHEIDCAITLLEVVKRHRHLAVLPAPMQFEIDRHSRNSDFVVVSKDHHAIGVQVKSRVTAAEFESYDPEYVVLIDSRIEQGDETARRISRRSSAPIVVSWGGQIAAERCAQLRSDVKSPIRRTINRKAGRAAKHARANLERVYQGSSSHLEEAVDAIGGRVLRAIEKE